ncbi:MAG: Methyltransferase type 11 [Candidatus Woesebacteria bacterium GW2011_GWA2_40_7b]|uniref:Methyltransferase type 11 n=1 Tax=Candidatus Woesebacteria bacterium GW2011_GWA2_40_7b TaxID=1618563 RepID=A0A0G0VFN9_9BACT|nr:MAG: Methyltransferase type 11 [Candidatus Woesebacteria bacterium GW2011_GWA2_40_7b]
MEFFEEELLEPIIRPIRFAKGLKNIGRKNPVILADLGCGPKIRFYNYATMHNIHFSKYIGIDPLLSDRMMKINRRKNILLIKDPLKNRIPLKNNSVDYITGFAFIEHVVNPVEILNDALRVLKPGGKAIFTTPTKKAKGVLEFLSFKLGIISKAGVREHKNYFEKKDLMSMVNAKAFSTRYEYFEFGFNSLFVIEKTHGQ